MPPHRRALRAILFIATIGACRSGDSNVIRGRGLTVAPLQLADQAQVYRAGLRVAFELDDPGLSLLLDSRFLPREGGHEGGPPMNPDLARALRAQRTVTGACDVSARETRKTLQCNAPVPGYVVRFSEIFALAQDSVETYLYVQKYDTPASGPTQALRFERVYQVVRHDSTWKAVREARLQD